MRKFLLLFALAVPAAAFAQETVDEGLSFSARTTVEVDAKLAKGLHLTAHEEFRRYFDSEDVMRSYSGIGLEYKVTSFLKVGAEYEFIERCKFDSEAKANEWTPRHRGQFFATGTLQAGDWQFGLKETFRMTGRTDDVNLYQSPKTALALKSKLSVKYRGWGKTIPYVALEMRNALNDASYSATYNPSAEKNKDRYTDEVFLGYRHAYADRYRVQAGVTVKFSKAHELDFYLIGDHYNKKEIDTNREGSDSWKEHGLVLKSITWHTGNQISAGIAYKWSF